MNLKKMIHRDGDQYHTQTKGRTHTLHIDRHETHGGGCNVPVLALLVVLQVVLDHVNHDLVTDQSTGVHDLLGLETNLGLVSNGSTKHVAGSQVADAELLLDLRGLGTFAWNVCKPEESIISVCKLEHELTGQLGMSYACELKAGSALDPI